MDPLWTLALTVAAIAAVTDGRTGRIPDVLTGTALAAALVTHGAIGVAAGGAAGGVRAIGWALLGAAVCGTLPAILSVRGAMGGGDVKLLVALGAICLPMRGFAVVTYGFAFAAVMAAGQLAYRGELFGAVGRALSVYLSRILRRRGGRPDHAAMPPALVAWFRLGPSVLAGVVVAWGLDP